MMEKLFLDTNIVLDLIGNREPFVKEAAFLFQLGRNKECQLFVSDLTFVNIAYITRKTYPKEKLYSVLSKLRSFLTIVGGGVVAVDHALALQADDFEDAVQYYAARQADAEEVNLELWLVCCDQWANLEHVALEATKIRTGLCRTRSRRKTNADF